MAPFQLESPYKNLATQNSFKGMWHAHLPGPQPTPAQARQICQEGGYDFVGITEHDNRFIQLTWTEADWQQGTTDSFVMIRGFEASHPTVGHISCLGIQPEQVGIDTTAAHKRRFEKLDLDAGYTGFFQRAAAHGAFMALNHPGGHTGKVAALRAEPGIEALHALEIYNGNRLSKEKALADELYDQCLGAGWSLWAAANPDCHKWDTTLTDGPFNGYSVVYAAELSEEAILTALKQGQFYASNGLEIRELEVSETSLTVGADCEQIRFIGPGSRVLKTVAGCEASYSFTGDEGYVRAELLSQTIPPNRVAGFPAMAWLQPVWVRA